MNAETINLLTSVFCAVVSFVSAVVSVIYARKNARENQRSNDISIAKLDNHNSKDVHVMFRLIKRVYKFFLF